MKRKLFILLALVTLVYLFFQKREMNDLEKRHSNSEIIGETALVFNQKNGELLYSKNENARVYPASTTKIMTAIVALEFGNLDDEITVGKEVKIQVEGESSAFLQQNQTYTLRQLLSALMLPSGNDAARTIAVYIAKRESGYETAGNKEAIAHFVNLMNAKAKDLGADDTHFANPSGLHDDNHYTTASDMALIVREAMNNDVFQEIVKEEQYSDQNVTFNNTNLLLQRDSSFYYEGADGIKTGFTNEAGRCLISSATVDGETIISIIFKSTEEAIWQDSVRLLDYGFYAMKTGE